MSVPLQIMIASNGKLIQWNHRMASGCFPSRRFMRDWMPHDYARFRPLRYRSDQYILQELSQQTDICDQRRHTMKRFAPIALLFVLVLALPLQGQQGNPDPGPPQFLTR